MADPRLPLPCLCGRQPVVSRMYDWAVYCDDCYDGAPDSPTRGEIGLALTRVAAVQRWNERVSEMVAAERGGAR